ncbi:COX15/CtaA family protein [Candidatus Protofrankia californiensis]|uniref:COX15/CtaA family protein n=1 Tax=Candidatus Protofrankia californiensis TaxID=1839754 RepID=UPI0013EE2A4C|nr:COX15/CtaA family protein [Candidatus Protofrankia californiensis]
MSVRRPLQLPTVSPMVFRRLTRISVILLALIVVTGGAVRLTGSGLGCPTWPRCGENSFVTQPEYAAHGWIEFGNRLLTTAVGLVMLLLPLVSLRLGQRRRDLVLLSFGLWLGFLGQVVLGGLTVLFKLHPALVAGHFLLSMLLLLDVVVLDRRARSGPGVVRPACGRELLGLARLLVAVAGAVLVLGTVVTGTGPHSGDSTEAKRFGFDITNVAQLHADAAMLLVGLVVATVLAVRVGGAPREAVRASTALAAIAIAQAGVGFTQYFTGIPVGLVELHIAGATALWIVALRVWLAMVERPAPVDLPVPATTDPADAIEPAVV